jgi:hypothetical protein
MHVWVEELAPGTLLTETGYKVSTRQHALLIFSISLQGVHAHRCSVHNFDSCSQIRRLWKLITKLEFQDELAKSLLKSGKIIISSTFTAMHGLTIDTRFVMEKYFSGEEMKTFVFGDILCQICVVK